MTMVMRLSVYMVFMMTMMDVCVNMDTRQNTVVCTFLQHWCLFWVLLLKWKTWRNIPLPKSNRHTVDRGTNDNINTRLTFLACDGVELVLVSIKPLNIWGKPIRWLVRWGNELVFQKTVNRIGGVMVKRARLECWRSLVRAAIGTNQRLWHWYLLLLWLIGS